MATDEKNTKNESKSRISDAEWTRKETEYLKPFIGLEAAMKVAKRNVKKRDIYDRVRAK